MPLPPITVECLRRLIGRRVQYQGVPCQIIEVLEEEPMLVLQEVTHQGAIQPDQFGKARRRVPEVFEIRVHDSTGQWSTAFLALSLFPGGEELSDPL